MSTGSSGPTTPEPTWDIAKKEISVRLIICTLYVVVFVLGVAGNALVVFVVVRNKSMQTITNIFIGNLALSDILMCLVATPFTPFALYMENWTLPSALCKILPMTMGVSVYVSTLTSTAIAVDRYFVIVHPFIPRMKTWLCFLIIFAVWIIAILISMPLAVYQQKQYNTKKNLSSCHENWPKESSREVFTIVSFVLQFVVPCSIISVCYLKVSMVLRLRCRTKIGSGTKNRQKEELEIRRKRRTNKMLIAMVSIFVVCWIPLNVLWMVTDVLAEGKASDLKTSNYFTLVFFVCHLLAMSSAVYNPFLYAWMNENFKKEFRNVIPCFFSKLDTNDNSKAYRTNFTTNNLSVMDIPEENSNVVMDNRRSSSIASDNPAASVGGSVQAKYESGEDRVLLTIEPKPNHCEDQPNQQQPQQDQVHEQHHNELMDSPQENENMLQKINKS